MIVEDVYMKIRNKEVPHFMLFTGEETTIAKTYIYKIKDVFDLIIVKRESVKDVLKELNFRGFGQTKNRLFIVNDDKVFKNSEKLWKKIPLLFKTDYLILRYKDLDKRTKFYKFFTNTLLEENNSLVSFDKLKTNLLIKYIQQRIELNKTESGKLVELCGNSYDRILLECDKIENLYLNFLATKTYSEVFNMLVREKQIKPELHERNFEFVDNIVRNDISGTFKILEEVKELKTSEIMLLALLYSNFRSILSIQSMKHPTPENTGLTSGQIYNLKYKTGRYTIEELVENLEIIKEHDKFIKLGMMESDMVLDSVVTEVLRRR